VLVVLREDIVKKLRILLDELQEEAPDNGSGHLPDLEAGVTEEMCECLPVRSEKSSRKLFGKVDG